ncbi:MAG: type II toxin-antitoxin system PrlF family antitoxin [Pseudomonadota bacterium]
MTVSRITSKGQTTLPIELRKALGLSAGDRIRYVRQPDGRYLIEKLERSFADLRGLIQVDGALSQTDIEDAVDRARAALGTGDDRA